MARPRRTVLEYRSYELPADLPVIALTGERWRISPVQAKHLHFHNCLEIGICLSSGGTMLFDRRRVHFSAGDVTCIARNVPHTTWSDPGEKSLWSYIFMEPEALLGSEFMAGCAGLADSGRFLSDCGMILPAEEYPWAAGMAQGIISELTARAPGYQTSVRGLCAALLINFLRAYALKASDPGRDTYIHALAPAMDYIHDHYMQEFPQETLAEVCHLSPTHFRRLFREQTGTSPLDFLHRTRILKSCALLRSSMRSVTEIAGMVGYNTLSSYNRHFSAAMGCTPTVWRRTEGNNQTPSLLSFSGWTEAETIEPGDGLQGG